MDVGIGLPATIPGADRESVLGWARGAEEAGFSSVGTIDRLVYPNHESLISLAAAAGVTERIRLATTIVLAPLRNAAILAKQALTLDSLSGGRLVLGLAAGAREDDFEAAGVDFHARGRGFERQLVQMKSIWGGEAGIGPPGSPELVLGGATDAAFRRAARHASGWIMGGGAPEQFAERLARVRAAWEAEGRADAPRVMALAYFSLGPDARRDADGYILDYYGYLREVAEGIAASVATDAEAVSRYLSGYAEAGCDELVFFPCSTDPRQVDLLAEAALG